ncbi:MAG: SRPBCC domain-containing protein [Patulibacter minatonensis]
MEQARVDTTGRWIAANTREVWAALIDPAARRHWLPPEDATATIDGWDFTLAGGYRMAVTHAGDGRSPGGTDIVDATFTRLAANAYLEETIRFVTDDPAFAGPMRLQWRLHPAGQGTLVEAIALDVPDAIDRHDHVAALAVTLHQLADAVEQHAAA